MYWPFSGHIYKGGAAGSGEALPARYDVGAPNGPGLQVLPRATLQAGVLQF
jgi:hypothetical protein